LKNLI